MAANGLIVFARMASRRLPGKALHDVAGRPLLGRVLDRARRVPNATLVVATTAFADDDALARYAEAEGVSVFRGAAGDVAGRALACARAYGFVRFGRVTGDSPFMDPGLFTRLLERHEAEGLDLATNVFPRSFPPGLSAEVVATDALARVTAATSEPCHREHATKYIYEHADAFRIANVAAGDGRYAGLHLAVDTADDLARATSIAHRLGPRAATAALDEIAELALAFDARDRARA
ncbi:MAG: NTP transferase domain-containing protein [Alphaproteobacteria bacterium]